MQNKFDLATKHYEKALQINPDFLDAHANYAFTLTMLGKLDKAVFHYKQVLRIDPDNTNAKISLKKILNQKDKLEND